jgi:hypothetical protein
VHAPRTPRGPSKRTIAQRVRNRLRLAFGVPLRCIGDRLGYDVLLRHYYSPVPDVRALPESVWNRQSPLDGVALDLDQQLEFLETRLGQFVPEFSPPLQGSPKQQEFFLDNGRYGRVDAEILFAMVRQFEPKLIIELGSGRSTQVIQAALAGNQSRGISARHWVIDPFPSELIQANSGSAEIEERSVTDLSGNRFAALSQGDILFVDTTHTVKMASDVNFLVLDVLPSLAPGVVVHFHDIFLPWEYPRAWLEKLRRFWAEQYLLQAFLAFNGSFEVLLAAHAIARQHPERLRRVVPTFATGVEPAAFWIRRTS